MMLYGIHCAAWHNIWLLLVYVAVVAVLIYGYRWRFDAIARLSAVHRARAFTRASWVRSGAQLVLSIIGFLFLFITALQPQWDEKEQEIKQQGRDVLIALDISRSMLAEDMQPNRLTFAKQKIKQLVRQLDSERVGLILFAGDAFVQCPLTQDKQAFGLFLDQVDAQTISSGTTALDKALHKAIDVYAAMPHREHRIVVVFTDGEDFSSGLGHIKRRARDLGMHLFTVGIGTTEGAPVPMVDRMGQKTGYEQEANGSVIMTRLNKEILEQLAHDIGGEYIHATSESKADVDSIVAHVAQFEKETFDNAHVSRLQDQYPFFIAVSFVCFLLEWLL